MVYHPEVKTGESEAAATGDYRVPAVRVQLVKGVKLPPRADGEGSVVGGTLFHSSWRRS